MKKLLMLCLLAYTTQAVAQTKSVNIDSLIGSNSFNFVVTEVRQNYSMKASSNVIPVSEIPNVNTSIPNAVSIAVISDTNIGSDVTQQRVDRLESLDAAYGTPFNTPRFPKGFYTKPGQALYFSQSNDKFIINNVKNPSTVNSIEQNDFSSVSSSNYKLKSVKKKNGMWVLTYRVKESGKRDIFYLVVNQDGSASFTKNAVLMIGFVMSS
ncbi:MAG: hypothetical protein EOP00_28985 [Pedobacter sp.]|nr:MAG: hypothetical protein EOP00_28985 [Pedobacter sp.]